MKKRQMWLHFSHVLIVVISALIVPITAHGQAITGRLVGTVQDNNQGAVPNAKVTITNLATNLATELQTDSQGNYVAPSLPSGMYKVTVAANGFRQSVASNVSVNVAQTTRLDVTLEVGNVQETVEVTGAAALVQSTTSDLGEIVDRRQIQTLPLNGRIFSQLIQLVPGAVPAGFGAAPEAGSTAGARSATSASVNGLPWVGTTYYMDGIENKETLNAFISMSPPIEAIEEFKVQTNSASAEYGAFGGGVVNLTLRSGTNEFHGSLFEYLRNDALNARDFFAASKNPFKTNQFGGTFGGPIVKNKAFFFGDYQGLRLRGGRPFTASVPTQAMREGRFLASEGFTATIYDPLSSADPTQRAAFANNQIPTSRIDPVSAKALALWPLPNRAGLVNNYIENISQRQDFNQIDIRGDYQFAKMGRLFVRESYSKRALRSALPNAPFLAFGEINSDSRDHNAVIGHSYSFTPTLLNEFRFGFNRFNTEHYGSDSNLDKNNELGIKNGNLTAFPETRGVANFGVPGLTGTGAPGFTNALRLSNTYQLTENMTWVKKAHTIKFGADLKRIESTLTNPESNPRGFFNFNTNFTSRNGTGGAAFASFLLGYPDNYGRSIVDTRPAVRMFFGGFYVQDDWRVTRKLTLNLGLRYDIFTHPRERHNRHSNLDLGTGKIVLATDDNRGPNIDTYTKNFGPRIGFAYSPDEGKTAVRASFGMGYFPDNFGATGGTLERNYPFFQTFSLAASDRFTPFARLSVDGLPGFISQPRTATIDPPAGLSLFYIPSNFRQDTVVMWQLSVQRQLHATGVAEIAYVGNHGYHLFSGNRNINVPLAPGPGAIDPRRPYFSILPRNQTINQRNSDGSSSYHGLQFKYSKRFSAGLQALVSYTWSKTIDDTNLIWPHDNRINRGVGTGKAPDIPHVLSASYLYELPMGKGKPLLGNIPRPLDFVIGGWQVNGITSLRSGTPLVVTVATSQLNTGTNNYADLKCSEVGRPKTVEQWFDTSCFTAPAQFVFGNSGKSHVRGPGVVNFDLSLFKKFALDEKRALEFRAEFFNAFNNPHFANPNTSQGASNFGRISGTVLTPREIQFGLKLSF
jgi:hypothetical protein